MNKAYKVIWSKARNCYVVASELAKSHTKSPKSGVIGRSVVAGILACVMSCGAVLPAMVYAAAADTVTSSAANTTKLFLLGHASAGTAAAKYDSNIYATTTAGQLHVGSLQSGGAISGTTGTFNNIILNKASGTTGMIDVKDSIVGYDTTSGVGRPLLRYFDKDNVMRGWLNFYQNNDLNVDSTMELYTSGRAGDHAYLGIKSIYLPNSDGGRNVGYLHSNASTILIGEDNDDSFLNLGERSVGIGNEVISYGYESIAIGTNAYSPNNRGISFGSYSRSIGDNSSAIGLNTAAIGRQSVALGTESIAVDDNVISVGYKKSDPYYASAGANPHEPFESSHYSDYFRRVVNVANGIDDHDVSTVGQLNTEATARSDADTGLSNRIGSLSADGNYIKKSATNNVSANLTALDTQLKTTVTAVSTETTNRTNADTALSNRIGSVASDGTFIKKSATNDVAANLTALDTAAKNAIKGLSVSGTTITYTKGDGTTGTITTQDNNTTYDSMTASELSTGTATTARSISAKVLGDYVTGKVSAETTARTTAINSEASTRQSEDTALSNRIGSLSTDGNYIKKSATNNVSANLTALDTQLKTTATAVSTETTNRTNADTALSNCIGSLTADGNYIKKAGTKNVSENLSLLDVQLKTTTDGLANEVTNRTNAVSSEATARTNADTALGIRIDNVTSAYQSADTGLSNRIGSVASDGTFIKKSATNDVATNLTALDTAAKNAIKTLSVSGTTITYTKGDGTTGTITTQDNNTTYNAGTANNLTTGTDTTGKVWTSKVLADYVKGQVATETTNRTTAVSNEATARSDADTALSNRIGTLSSNGYYIKKSATNNMATNMTLLDYQLKATNDNITGFASDITRNKNSIATLNTSVSSALSSVGAASSVIDLLSNTKADASLANLNASGKRVIANAAMNAVQEYMASQNGTVTPSAPMMYANNSNTLAVNNAGNGSLHVGEGSYVNGTSSIAIGVGNQVNANNSGAFGDPSVINADASYVLGNDDTINTGATGSFLIGNDSVSSAENGLSLGSNNKLEESAKNSIALGNNITVTGKNSVALGNDSTVTEDNTVSVGSATSKRRITNVMNGEISENSSEVVTGNQLFVTNEKVKANEKAIAKKADIDASNINVNDWTAKLGTGKVEEGNTGLITGGNVFTAIQTASSQNLVQTDGQAIHIGKNSDATVINVLNSAGENRVITGVKTDPSNPYSVANVGYVDAVNTNLANSMSQEFANMNDKMNKMGANAAAMASLTPASFEGDERWSLSAGVGNYRGETAGAVGAFYRPAENVMMNVRGSFGNNENMVGAAVSVSLSKGDIPGVTKRQLANTVNKQAEAINTLQQNQQKDQQLIANILQAREQDQQKLNEYEHKMIQQDKQIKELLKRLEVIEKR